MKEELLEHLKKLMEMQEPILTRFVKEPGSSVVDKDKVIGQGKLMEMYCPAGSPAVPEHSHNFIEIIYMYRGATIHVINGTRVLLLEPQNLLLLKQGTSHSVEAAGEDDVAVHFLLAPEFFLHPMLKEEIGNVLHHLVADGGADRKSSGAYLHCHLENALSARNLLENLIWSFVEKRQDRQEINQATMEVLIMELLYDIGEEELHHEVSYEEQIALDAYQYLENNYSTATLEALSAKSMQPSYYISRLFKRYFQMTFTECLQMIRMIAAAGLLVSTSRPVEEIAADVGYENSSYFHQIFKRRYGMTPKQYRDKAMERSGS